MGIASILAGVKARHLLQSLMYNIKKNIINCNIHTHKSTDSYTNTNKIVGFAAVPAIAMKSSIS
jgi:hypothetical protein